MPQQVQKQQLGVVCPVPLGEYNPQTAYQKLNMVTYNESTFIAKIGNQGITPLVAADWETYWMRIAAGEGITSTEVAFQIGESATVPPVGEWSNEQIEPVPGKYLWTKVSIVYTNLTSKEIMFPTYEGQDAGFGTISAKAETLDPEQEATASVEESGDNKTKNLSFSFGIPRGKDAGFGDVTAEATGVDAGIAPTAEVKVSGEDTKKNFAFKFRLPKSSPFDYDSLTEEQQAALNSGITPEDVAQIAENKTRSEGAVRFDEAQSLSPEQQKQALDNLGINGQQEIPVATEEILGGVKSTKTGTTSNRNYNVEVNADGTMKVNVPWTDTYSWSSITGKPSWIGSEKPSYSWSEITSKPTWIGSSKPTYSYSEISDTPSSLKNPHSLSITVNGSTTEYDGSTARSVTISSGGTYTLPAATSNELGGIKTGYATSSTNRNYKVDTDTSGNAYVNVPWSSGDLTWASASVSSTYSSSGTYLNHLYNTGSGFSVRSSTHFIAGDGITISRSGSTKASASITFSANVSWSDVSSKPSWIGSSKPTYSYSEISGLGSLATKDSISASDITGDIPGSRIKGMITVVESTSGYPLARYRANAIEYNPTGSTTYDFAFPSKGGTLALTKDIPQFTVVGSILRITTS